MSVIKQAPFAQSRTRDTRALREILYHRSLDYAGWLMDGTSAALRHFSQRQRYGVVDLITAPMAPLMGRRMRVIAQNYATILDVEPSDPVAQRLARESIQNYGRMAMDFLAARTMSDEETLRWVRCEGVEHLAEAQRGGKGVILALPHLGSWDVAAVFAQAFGCELTIVTESNWGTELVAGSRREHGVTLAPRDEGLSLRLLFRSLARNECVVMLSDMANEGVQTIDVPFFGRPAPFPMGPARLSHRTGAPIMVVASVRQPDGTYLVQAQPLLRADRRQPADEAAMELTTAMARGFERIIANYPAQWYPFHPIWRSQLASA